MNFSTHDLKLILITLLIFIVGNTIFYLATPNHNCTIDMDLADELLLNSEAELAFLGLDDRVSILTIKSHYFGRQQEFGGGAYTPILRGMAKHYLERVIKCD